MSLLPGMRARMEQREVSRDLDRLTHETPPPGLDAFLAAVKRCGCTGTAIVQLEELAWRLRIDGDTAAAVLDQACR